MADIGGARVGTALDGTFSAAVPPCYIVAVGSAIRHGVGRDTIAWPAYFAGGAGGLFSLVWSSICFFVFVCVVVGVVVWSRDCVEFSLISI